MSPCATPVAAGMANCHSKSTPSDRRSNPSGHLVERLLVGFVRTVPVRFAPVRSVPRRSELYSDENARLALVKVPEHPFLWSGILRE